MKFPHGRAFPACPHQNFPGRWSSAVASTQISGARAWRDICRKIKFACHRLNMLFIIRYLAEFHGTRLCLPGFNIARIKVQIYLPTCVFEKKKKYDTLGNFILFFYFSQNYAWIRFNYAYRFIIESRHKLKSRVYIHITISRRNRDQLATIRGKIIFYHIVASQYACAPR